MACADLETSSDDYASRFAGKTGRWLLEIQARILHGYFKGSIHNHQEPVTVLDVGGGHGQIAEALNGSSFAPLVTLTVLGSDPAAKQTLESVTLDKLYKCEFQVGSFERLPFPDQSIDLVTCLRLLPHYDNWQHLVGELCRVSRRAVIVDVPTYRSVNILSHLLFPLKKRLEGNTRTYTLFDRAEVVRCFAKNKFDFVDIRGEFFFPMVLHRKLKSPIISELLEALPRVLGLTDGFGSPVLMRAIRG